MTRLPDRLRTDLQELADCVSASPGAWDATRERFSQPGKHEDARIFVLDADHVEPGRRHLSAWMVAASLTILLMAGFVAFTVAGDSSALFAGGTRQPTEVTDGGAAPNGSAESAPLRNFPSISDRDEQLVVSLVDAMNRGDVSAVLGSLGPDSQVGSSMLNLPSSTVPFSELSGTFEQFLRFLVDRDTRWSISSCKLISDDQISCSGTWAGEVFDQAAAPAPTDSLQLIFRSATDDRFSILRLTPIYAPGRPGGYPQVGGCWARCKGTPWVKSAAYIAFLEWIDDEYPTERALLMDDSLAYVIGDGQTEATAETAVYGAYPNFTTESRALWTRRVDEWVEAGS